MYILDTNVLSELRKPSRRIVESVESWANTLDSATVYLSVVSLLEIEIGARRKLRRDPEQGRILLDWLHGLRSFYRGRILNVDERVAAQCAPLHVPSPRSYPDALIGATALTHNLTVATRNVKDFVPLGVEVFNPWEYTG